MLRTIHPAPRLVKGSDEYWLLSTNEDQTEAIASSQRRSLLFLGAAGDGVLAGADPGATLGGANSRGVAVVEWEPDPHILSDLPVGRDPGWSSSQDLLERLGQADRHSYVLSARHPAALVAAFQAGPIAVPCTPVVLYGHILLVGPTLQPGRGPCGRCWGRRLVANLPSLAQRIARGHRLIPSLPVSGEALAGAARLLWEARTPLRPPGEALVLNLATGAVDRQRLIPDSNCDCVLPASPGRLSDLEGDLLGIVHSVGSPDQDGAPLTVLTAQSRVAPRIAWGAAASTDPALARRRALGEAAERLAASQGAAAAFQARAADLSDAPPLADLRPYTQDQYDSAGFPYRPLGMTDETLWLAGRDLATDQPRSLPAGLVTLDPRCRPAGLAPQTSNGIAAGPGWPQAVQSALLETVERDLVTRAWYSGRLGRIEPMAWAPAESERLVEAGFDLWLALARPGSLAPVAIAYVRRSGAPAGAYGSAAGLSLAAAASHAVEEAVLMLVHRERLGTLRPLDPRWPALPPVDESTALRLAVRWPDLIRRYRPVAVDLTCRETESVGVRVAAVWSPIAVDFPRNGEPLPLNRWRPSVDARRRLAGEPDLFAGGPDGD